MSENWTFQQTNRRWSRVGEMEMQKPTIDKLSSALNTSRESSPEQTDPSDEQMGFSTLPIGVTFSQSQGDEQEPVRLRRTGSERLKDGAKALLRRVESIKSRRRKRQNRDGIVISGPQTLDLSHISPKMTTDLKCNIITMSTPPSPVPSSPYTTILTNNKHIAAFNNNELKVNTADFSSIEKLSPNHLSPRHHTFIHTTSNSNNSHSNRTSPLHFFTTNPGLNKDLKGSGDDSSSYCSDASQDSSGGNAGSGSTGGGSANIISTIPKKRPSRSRRFLQKGSKVEDIGALSDSECQQILTRNRMFHDGNQLTVSNNNNNNNNSSNNNNNSIDNSLEIKSSKFSRGGSLNLGKESHKFKETFKTRSFRSRSSARVKPDGEFDNKFRTRFVLFFKR